MRIGKQFEVLRCGEQGSDYDGLTIWLAKGRAFGSGDHETTRSCLEEMEKLDFGAKSRVLDLGCGTGILSVAAARLGAGWIAAVDPQENAVKASKETFSLNGLTDRVELICGQLAQVAHRRFDFVLSNLYGDILVALAQDLAACVNPGGYLLLSGILYQDNDTLKNRLISYGCKIITNRFMEEYTTLLLQKK